jgi:hypothetical protein
MGAVARSTNLRPTMAQSEIYTVFCIAVGENVAFPVEIDKDKTVGQLKKLIKEEKPTAFAGIDANLLDLYRLGFPSRNLSQSMNSLQLEQLQRLEDVTEPLEDVFQGAPKTRTIHILVQPPRSGKSTDGLS